MMPATTYAQTKEEKEILQAVENLRTAMINADSVELDKLTSADLSYGHSGGKIQTKAEFIHSLVSGESDFVSIDLTDESVKIFDHTAIVRHLFAASTNDNGNPGNVKLSILLVWQKQHGAWKLIARQAVKMPQP